MRFPLLAVLAAGLGCTSAHSLQPKDLQMNDLSVLLPLPRTQAELDAALAPTAPAAGGPLLPQDVYDTVGLGIAYESLRAVAFRLDPCFGQLGDITDGSACENQLRVVFQPLGFDPTSIGGFAEDSAVHAFYSLTREQLLDAVGDVIAARQDDGGDRGLGPLAPHPIVAAEGLDGPLAHAFDAIVTKYAGATNLVRLTALQIEQPLGTPVAGSQLAWFFQNFTVASGALTPHAIPTLAQGDIAMNLAASVEPLAGTLSPMTTSSDNLGVLVDFMQASQATAADRQRAFGAALRVLNPRDNSPDTIDCASCHMAQPAVELVGEQLGMNETGNPDAFVPAPTIPHEDLEQTTSLFGMDEVLNVHAFSYRTQAPMINQRVINETAANLAYIATLLQ